MFTCKLHISVGSDKGAYVMVFTLGYDYLFYIINKNIYCSLRCLITIIRPFKAHNFDVVHTQSCAIKQDINSLIETDSLIYTCT